MATVQRWTGAETKALRQAMRLSIRAFAAHLGVDARTVNKWEARDNAITLLPDTQALLDTALERAPDHVQTRFAQTLDSASRQQQRHHHPEFAERVTPRTAIPIDDWNTVSDAPSIATIRAMSESFQVADRKLGGGLLYNSATRYIKFEIAPSLVDPPRDCSSSELFSAAASLTEVAGWMAHDGGNDNKSQGHFNQAYHLTVAAENPVLSANVCASLSHLAIQRGQAEDAARISAAGLARATHGEGPMHLVSRLHAMRARAAAMQSRAKECHVALEAAGDEAEDRARKVIELRRIGDRVRSRTFGQLTLANVLVKAGAVEEAARIGSEICLVAASLNSARVRSGISRLGKSLGGSRTIPDVALFLDHLAQLTDKTAAVSHDRAGWPL
jgi:transcriptional regulator with XRE-family HTH domain